MKLKDLIEEVTRMHKAGCSVEYIAIMQNCSEELIEQTIQLIEEIEYHYERTKP